MLFFLSYVILKRYINCHIINYHEITAIDKIIKLIDLHRYMMHTYKN